MPVDLSMLGTPVEVGSISRELKKLWVADQTRTRATLFNFAILCEGGPNLFASLIGAGLVDELCLTLSPILAGPGPGRIESGPLHPVVPLALAGLLEEDGALFTRYAVARQAE